MPLRKKRRASDILKDSSKFGDATTQSSNNSAAPTSPNESNNKAVLKLNDKKVLNVARSRAIYEKAKSRRVRTKTALAQSGSAEGAVALTTLRRGSSTGKVSSFGMARHQYPDDGGDFSLENQMEEKARTRTIQVRHSLKKQCNRENDCRSKVGQKRKDAKSKQSTKSTVAKGKSSRAKHSDALGSLWF